jgi:prepilin-type N-terminal cleavage/methylation domain-containing protein
MSDSCILDEHLHMRKQLRGRDESGFTLIEVLTVSAIIGILSSIAIPVLRSQPAKAQTATAASDLRNTATAMESYFADKGTYGSATELTADGVGASVSKGSIVVIVQHNGTDYCLAGLRNTAMPTTISGLRNSALRWYDSAAGGLQSVGSTGCPTTTAVASDWQTDVFARS